MYSIKGIAATMLLSCIIFCVGAQTNKTNPQTLFSVNKKPLLIEEFVYVYRKNHQNNPEAFTKNEIEKYLSLFINYKLKVEEALIRGYDTTAVFKKEYATYRDELLKPYLPGSQVVDSLVILTYERLKEEINAAHILIGVKGDALPSDTLLAYQKIQDLRNRIIAGENFGVLAAAYSEEPRAELTGGNLGYFTALQMVFPFEQAAYQTPVGGISQPIRTQFGYHLIHVLNRRPSRGEVEVSHIMLRTGEGADSDNVKDAIFDIYDKLNKGVEWLELCKQFSEDPNSKEKGGLLRPFGVGAMASVPEFEEMAFSLHKAGEISDPFQTQFGWHILRLESKIPLPPFEELKASLTNRVGRDERVQISREAVRKKMKIELGYTENITGISTLMALADSVFTKGNWEPIREKMTESEILFKLQDQTFRVKDFLEFAMKNQEVSADLPPPQFLEQTFTRFVDAAETQVLEEKIKNQFPDYKWLLKEYYEGILLFEIMEKEVWNKASEDTVGQLQYFKEHATDYKANERIAGRIYTSTLKTKLEELKNMIAQKDSSFQDFIKKNRVRMEAGFFEKADRPILGHISWTPGLHLADNNGTNYLILIEKILPPGPKTFSEARASVISDYQAYLEDSWIKNIRKELGVKINKRGKKMVFEQLVK